MSTAKFCLAAGGGGYDMLMRVPVLTAESMSYPYDDILDYNKFAVVIDKHDERLQNLPETLSKVQHAPMVKRITSCTRLLKSRHRLFFTNRISMDILRIYKILLNQIRYNFI